MKSIQEESSVASLAFWMCTYVYLQKNFFSIRLNKETGQYSNHIHWQELLKVTGLATQWLIMHIMSTWTACVHTTVGKPMHRHPPHCTRTIWTDIVVHQAPLCIRIYADSSKMGEPVLLLEWTEFTVHLPLLCDASAGGIHTYIAPSPSKRLVATRLTSVCNIPIALVWTLHNRQCTPSNGEVFTRLWSYVWMWCHPYFPVVPDDFTHFKCLVCSLWAIWSVNIRLYSSMVCVFVVEQLLNWRMTPATMQPSSCLQSSHWHMYYGRGYGRPADQWRSHRWPDQRSTVLWDECWWLMAMVGPNSLLAEAARLLTVPTFFPSTTSC